MKIILFLFVLISLLHSFAQTDQQNLEKYWKFRNTFREQFIKIGPNDGESLPAGSIKPCACVDDLYPSEDKTEWGVTCYGEMHWGDGMIRHGHYLGLLATEYRLLKNSGGDVTGVLNELFYALNVINRLDLKAESEQAKFYNLTLNGELNGFFIREDVGQDFGLNWKDEPTSIRGTNSVLYYNQRASGGIPNGSTVFGNSYQNVPSNDQVSSLMVGLSLIHKLVDSVFVQPPNSKIGFNIVLETAAIVDRLVRFAADHNWQLIDVNGWPVGNGGGDMLLMAYPLIKASQRITGLKPTSYDLSFTRKIIPYNWLQHCITGYGSNDKISQSDACREMGILQKSQRRKFNSKKNKDIINNMNSSLFQKWEMSGKFNSNIKITSFIWTNIIPNNYLNGYEDFEKTRKLPFLPWPLKAITWDKVNISDYNNTILFNYGIITGEWTKYQADKFADISGNRCLELINAVIRHESPLNNKSFYNNYLNGLTPFGPFNIAGFTSDPLKLNKFHENGWATEYRWTNPGESIVAGGNEGMFSALDYMLYHNLYYLLFEKELPPFKEKYNCFCSDELAIDLSKTTSLKYLANYDQQVIKQIIENLNKKLAYLPNCVSDVFETVNNNVQTVFEIKPKFSNYNSLEILTNEFQTENTIIKNNGNVNLRTRLILCNNSVLTLDSAGRMDIYGGELLLNDRSILAIFGEVHLHSGSKLKLVGTGSKIILHPGGKLIFDENTLIENELGSEIELYDGGEIITPGVEWEAIISGMIKKMNVK